MSPTRYRRLGLCLFGILSLVTGVLPTAALGFGDDPAVRRFLDLMATKHSFDEAELVGLFAKAKSLPKVLEAISRPAEAKPWYEYRPIFLTPTRVASGVDFWQAQKDTLARAEAEYGVAPEIIVAIIGVETLYGRRTGSFRVLDALTTLAFGYPPRADFFRGELEEFLLLTREERLDPLSIKGSYAGAMGVPQFISSSYRRFAVDFDADGARDLLQSPVDAIGSVANYLKAHGWRTGGAVTFPAAVSGDAIDGLVNAGLEPHTALADMRKRGVAVQAAIPEADLAALIKLENKLGFEYWIGLRNFYAITRYNHSQLYAMAVFQLAEAIRAEYGGANG